jgi:hypothetical protein
MTSLSTWLTLSASAQLTPENLRNGMREAAALIETQAREIKGLRETKSKTHVWAPREPTQDIIDAALRATAID